MKKTLKIVLIVISILFINVIGVSAAIYLGSNEVSFNPPDGLNSTNVQDAIDELYSNISEAADEGELACPYVNGAVVNDSKNGDLPSFIVKCSGVYRIEYAGASGGKGDGVTPGYAVTVPTNGSPGKSYTVDVELKKGTLISYVVGTEGQSGYYGGAGGKPGGGAGGAKNLTDANVLLAGGGGGGGGYTLIKKNDRDFLSANGGAGGKGGTREGNYQRSGGAGGSYSVDTTGLNIGENTSGNVGKGFATFTLVEARVVSDVPMTEEKGLNFVNTRLHITNWTQRTTTTSGYYKEDILNEEYFSLSTDTTTKLGYTFQKAGKYAIIYEYNLRSGTIAESLMLNSTELVKYNSAGPLSKSGIYYVTANVGDEISVVKATSEYTERSLRIIELSPNDNFNYGYNKTLAGKTVTYVEKGNSDNLFAIPLRGVEKITFKSHVNLSFYQSLNKSVFSTSTAVSLATGYKYTIHVDDLPNSIIEYPYIIASASGVSDEDIIAEVTYKYDVKDMPADPDDSGRTYIIKDGVLQDGFDIKTFYSTLIPEKSLGAIQVKKSSTSYNHIIYTGVDLTNYSSIHLEASSTMSTANSYVPMIVVKSTEFTTKNTSKYYGITTYFPMRYDVSSLTGTQYIGVAPYGYNTNDVYNFRIYNWWLE